MSAANSNEHSKALLIMRNHMLAKAVLLFFLALPLLNVSQALGAGLLREVYLDISGSSLDNLINAPKFPDRPDQTNIVTGFEAPTDVSDNYGQRLRGFIVPPVTGHYTFWIASDDNSALYLSTDESPSNKREIARVPDWTAPRDWTAFPTQRSTPIQLMANRKYYVEALMKEGGGGDNLAVRWQLPSGVIEEPVPGARLIPWGTSFTAPIIVTDPANVTVTEGQPVEFTVKISNLDPAVYQWQKNRVYIPDARAATYRIPAVSLMDNGSRFRVQVTNPQGSVFSGEATLTVVRDAQAPTIARVQNLGRNEIAVTFSETVEPASATSLANYGINNGISVRGARLEPDNRTVTLEVSDLQVRQTYVLTVNNVRDRASAANTIAPDTRFTFVTSEFAPADIGDPAMPGTTTLVPGGIDVITGGTGIHGSQDQVYFNQQKRTGDFDVKVRVQSLEQAEVWSTAGLMARESMAPQSKHAGILATPNISGIFMSARSSTDASVFEGYFPVNYPQTWVRLKRAGNVFRGYGSYDGRIWTLVSTVTNNLAPTVHLGLSASSFSTNRTARVQFRDFADITSETVGPQPIDIEPLGPSSRRTGLIISEIMYHPADRPDGKDLEYIELFNTLATPEDLGGFKLSGSISYTFPPKTILAPGSFLVVAKAPNDLKSVHGVTNVMGGFTGNLPNSSGTLVLEDNIGGVLLEVDYSDEAPWPASADGAGHALVLARPSYGEGNVQAWAASQRRGGSPGTLDSIQFDPIRAVRINEFLANTDEPQVDFIELYNYGNQAVDLSGAFLSDDAARAKFQIPPGTTLLPRGFVSFNQNQLGFSLSSAGEAIYLLNRTQDRVIDAVKFGPQANNVSTGRTPDGSSRLAPLIRVTPGTANSERQLPLVVINEIMYHPISENDDDEYVELFNRGTEAADLSHWQLTGGIEFVFPAGTSIGANGYLVVARNAARLLTNYPNLTPGNTVGNFSGRLSNSGERIALLRPENPGTPGDNLAVVNEVTYGEGGRWGRWSDGGGSSLELADARADNGLAPSWADSNESQKSRWEQIEATDVLTLGVADYGINSLQIGLMGPGECLIDDVEVIGRGGVNLVPNPSFEQGSDSWFMRGTHHRSAVEQGDAATGISRLHLRASGRGDTSDNNVRVNLLSSLSPGEHAIIRARVRWISGSPEILFRLRGNYMEAAARMTVPANPGTPGARNSRVAANMGPAITTVRHSPILPNINDPILVTARVDDPDGISSVDLFYRVDPSPTVRQIRMSDDGNDGDQIARDGIYTATIPGQPQRSTIAFYILAADNAPTRLNSRFPADAPGRECLVRVGEVQPAGNFGTYRIWVSQSVLNEWTARHPSSNDPLDATFAYGNFRAVYNIGTLYSGSPFHWTGYDSPISRMCNYMMTFPDDDPFLGSSDFVLNTPSNIGSDSTAQREQLFYWMRKELGGSYTSRRFVHLYFNGLRRGDIFEDAPQPNREFVEQWHPNDADGELFKIEDWFEYSDDVFSFRNTDATLEDFRNSDGEKKQARYRWIWRKRSVQNAAHDYRNLFDLADAVNVQEPERFTMEVERLVDIEQWMRTFALRHIVGDWDAFGYSRGKNMYSYKPVNGKWQMMNWDIAFAFGLGDPVNSDLFSARDAVSRRMYQHPPFRRAYLRAVHDALNGPLLGTNYNPVIDAKHKALVDNRIPVASPEVIKRWIEGRRDYLTRTLATNNAPFRLEDMGGGTLSVAGPNIFELRGTAPIAATSIRVNGVEFPATWSTVTEWNLKLVLQPGRNAFRIEAFDRNNVRVPGASDTIEINYGGTAVQPEQSVVINEIMYNPKLPLSGFIEILNTSPSHAFDLSDWRLNGTGFTFPPGSIIGPSAFLVIANDQAAFEAAYGRSISVFGVFPGSLDNGGETISLIKPGLIPTQDIVVDRVTYEDDLPWPAVADGNGASLQLVDATRDNRRVGNWQAAEPSAVTQGWRFATATGIAQSATLYFNLVSSGDVFLDDISLVEGSVAGEGVNLLQNGGFENGVASWLISESDFETIATTTSQHSGSQSLHIVSSEGGNIFIPSLEQRGLNLTPGGTYTLSFWYLPGASGGGLTAGLLNSDLQKTVSLAGVSAAQTALAQATPGAPNSVRDSLSSFPDLWINEVMPDNRTGATDGSGEREPWVEIYNAGSASISLDGFTLTDNYSDLQRWAFPSGARIEPGGFILVWLDGEPGETTATEWHANFRLNPGEGSIALVRAQDNQRLVYDYINYRQLPSNRSYGSFPDGDPHRRQIFEFPTPKAPNNNTSGPLQIFINEWMAANSGYMADPADNDYDDWFELFNPNPVPVDLSGYALADNAAGSGRWTIPNGTIIPAGGFLLFWADEEVRQNGFTNQLHADFKLSQNGESIVLFAPGGTVIDEVHFGVQRQNQSEGRFPDGGPAPYVAMDQPTPGRSNMGSANQGLRSSISVSAATGLITLSWPTQPGMNYQVQFKNDLNEVSWQNVGTPVAGTGANAAVSDTGLLTGAQRFYRILVLN